VNLATGLDGSGNVQTAGDSIDAHWQYSNSFFNPSTGQAKVVAPNNTDWTTGWLADGTDSSWIAPDPDASDNGPAPYTFNFAFDVSGYDLASLSISNGMWAIDDVGTVSLNGNILSSLNYFSFSSLTAFSAPSSDFIAGINTLTITMTGNDRFSEGVRLQGTVTGVLTPEPGNLVLLISGAILLTALPRALGLRRAL
jgi:hypothetical protein